VGTGWTARGGITALLLVLLPTIKWVQLEHWPGEDGLRQLLLVVVVLGVVAWAFGRRFWEAAVRRQVVTPMRPPAVSGPYRRRRMVTGVGAVVTIVVSACLVIAGAAHLAIAASIVAAAALVTLLVFDELRAARAVPTDVLCDHAIAWTVAPGAVLWCCLIAFGLIDGSFSPLTGPTFGLAGEAGSAAFTVVVVAFGEEYLYRGLLFALAAGTRLERGGRIALSVSFGLWHLPDALGTTLPVFITVPVVLVVPVATMLISHLALFPIRNAGRSLAGPWLLHSTNNLGLLLVI
jgi:membrane protease YdiL (CAAX protease family)